MSSLTRRTQILLDEDRYERLRAHADQRGASVATLIREAIDRTFPAVAVDRAQAARRLLDREPTPVEDWPVTKRAMTDEMWGGRVEVERSE